LIDYAVTVNMLILRNVALFSVCCVHSQWERVWSATSSGRRWRKYTTWSCFRIRLN